MKLQHFTLPLLTGLLMVVTTACDSDEPIGQPSNEVLSRSSVDEVAAVNFDVDRYFDSITAPERWIQYDSFREKLDVLNLPEDILPKLSTEKLAEACAKYPLGIIYMAYETPAQGAQVIIDNFNGYKELAKRYNYQGALINQYIYPRLSTATDQINVSNPSKGDENSIPNHVEDNWLKSCYMEAIFQTDYFNKNLSETDAMRLTQQLELDLVQSSDSSAYKRNSKASVLMKLQPSTYSIASTNGFKYCFIYTFHGKEILVYDFDEMSAKDIADTDSDFCQAFRSAKLIDHSSAKYNCHYYAWVGNVIKKYWMDDSRVYNGKTYKNVENYMTGDVNVRATVNDSYNIVYGNDNRYGGTHSMRYNPSTGKYISKWGQGPLMEHSENDMPYLMPVKQYFYHMEYGARIVPQDGDRAYAVGEELILKITGITLKSYLKYTITLYTGKGDDACDDGKASMTYDGAYTIRATFNFPGVYELYVIGTDSNGNQRECLSYQPVIEW